MGRVRDRFLSAWQKAETTGPVALEMFLGVASLIWGYIFVMYTIDLNGLGPTVIALGNQINVDLLGCGFAILGVAQIVGVLLLRASLREIAAFLSTVVWAFVLGTDASANELRLVSAMYGMLLIWQAVVYISLAVIFQKCSGGEPE